MRLIKCKFILFLAFSLSLISPAPVYTQESYVYPVMAPRLASRYGARKHPVLKVKKHHAGIDLATPRRAQIRAVKNGLVIFADDYAGYGNLIVLQHENGMTTHYGHCEKIFVEPGRQVTAGEVIGLVGSTGRVTGPHLHFEIRINGKAQNPEKFIPGLGKKAEG